VLKTQICVTRPQCVKTFGFGTHPEMGPKVLLGVGQIFSDWFQHLKTRLNCMSLQTDDKGYMIESECMLLLISRLFNDDVLTINIVYRPKGSMVKNGVWESIWK